MKSYLDSLKQREDVASKKIRSKHLHYLKIINLGLNEIIRAIDELPSQKQRSSNQMERIRWHLIVRSFNSFRTALHVFERGYTQQAWALMRMVMEDQLIAEDMEHHPPTLRALSTGEGKLGSGDLSFTKMAERVSVAAKENWSDSYGAASQYAAHPRHSSLQALVALDADGQFVLEPGSHYDESFAEILIYEMSSHLTYLMATTAKATEAAGTTWVADAMSAFQQVDTLCKQMAEYNS